MRAASYGEYGDPNVLGVTEKPEPHAGTGQVRVAVKAAAVNPFDLKLRSGAMSEVVPVTFPFVPGGEAAGVVDEIGDDVASVNVGDEVFGLGSHTNAQHAVLRHFAPKPRELDWPRACGAALAAETALRALRVVKAARGQTVVIDGAAGSVGCAAVQLAVAAGISVIGTCRADEAEFVRSLGALPTTYGAGLPERAQPLAPGGVHAAVDTAGKGSLPELIALTGDPDAVVSIADFTAPQLGAHVTSKPSAFDALDRVSELTSGPGYVIRVGREFSLDEIAEAHRFAETGRPRGKVVLLLP